MADCKVSYSEVIENLRILYLNDISGFKSNIENIFDEIFEFSVITP